jgi:S1-C subfamily serine protease
MNPLIVPYYFRFMSVSRLTQKMNLVVYWSQFLADSRGACVWLEKRLDIWLEKRLKFEAAALILFVCTLCVLLFFQLDEIKLMATIDQSKISSFSEPNRTSNLADTLTFLNQTLLSDLVDKVANAVIQINVVSESQNPKITFGGSPMVKDYRQSFGSGFLYDNKLNFVTNYHVVEDAVIVSARFPSGNSYSARVIGTDPISDLAVVQVDPSAMFREKISPLPIANSSTVEVGEPVVAIGNPDGLINTVTTGIVSQTGRISLDTTSGRYWVGDLIQTDADVNPGNSGGPLLNLDGEVIGVNDFIRLNPETGAALPGLNFAISSNTVQKVVPQLISEGSYSHPWIGAILSDVTPSFAEMVGLEDARGIVVLDVLPDSPAEMAGIVQDSVIFGVDGNPITQIADLIMHLETKVPNGNMILDAMGTDGIRRDVNLTLGIAPQAPVAD